jgi:multiple sugar transport system substrate-binding protein
MEEAAIYDQELLRLIDLIDAVRGPLPREVPGMDVDGAWDLVSYLIRSQVVDKPVTLSELIAVSGLPYTTAHRRIHEMLESGLIAKRPVQPNAKSFVLYPSPLLRKSFERYVQQMKVLLAETAGYRVDCASGDNYTFGSARKGLREHLPPATLGQDAQASRPGLKFLFHDDNYFRSLRNLWTDFRANVGTRRDFTIATMPEMYEALLHNATLHQSGFDIVALNLPWLPEFASKDLIAPLGDERGSGVIDPHEYHPTIWHCGTWAGRQYGVPLYIAVEALVVRTDLFDKANLPHPKTLKQLMDAARKLHQPRRGQYGMVWNGARGMPIASTFMFLLAAHGGSVLTKVADGRSKREGNERTRTVVGLDTAAARATMRFMRKLMEVSIPDVLDSDANTGLVEFMAGRAALGYIWSMRAARLEFDVRSKVKGLVKCLPHPNVSGVRCASPVGGYVLAVPSNLSKERCTRAVQAIKWLTTSVSVCTSVRNGIPVAPFFGVDSDPEMMATSKVVNFVDQLANQGLLTTDVRPAIPCYRAMEDVLGTVIHDAMLGDKSDDEALGEAQHRIEALVAEVP